MASGDSGQLVPHGITPIRLSPFNSERIETVVGRALGLIAIVFMAQSIPVLVSQAPALRPVAGTLLNVLLLLAIVVLALAVIARRLVRTATIGFALLFFVSLIAWPSYVVDAALLHGNAPWLWYLCTVATAAAAVGMNLYWATAYTVAVPVVYGLIRTHPAGGDAEPLLASLDGLYAAILGGVVLIIITTLRHTAVQVDQAQATALEAYATAVREHAIELERVQVDAIVHDSVLTTLLAAAGSGTPHEHQLAAVMATGALARLDEAGVAAAPLDAEVALARIAKRLTAAVQAFSAPIEVRTVGVHEQHLPIAVAEALYSAAVQAMVNSLQHAGDEASSVHRAVTIFGAGANGCRIEIIDNGRGFDEEATNRERLGLRVSIKERVRNAGGSVEVHSRVGVGTALALIWSGEPQTEVPR